jgi:antitoxin (DNA-binding transcriptional repressor) of toxin-antitoxin stability system
MIVSVAIAKAQLTALIARAVNGETIVIARAGCPVAILVAYQQSPQQRTPGALRGKIRMAADFDDLPRDIAAAFGVPVRRSR